jgi:hypothetical protein
MVGRYNKKDRLFNEFLKWTYGKAIARFVMKKSWLDRYIFLVNVEKARIDETNYNK